MVACLSNLGEETNDTTLQSLYVSLSHYYPSYPGPWFSVSHSFSECISGILVSQRSVFSPGSGLMMGEGGWASPLLITDINNGQDKWPAFVPAANNAVIIDPGPQTPWSVIPSPQPSCQRYKDWRIWNQCSMRANDCTKFVCISPILSSSRVDMWSSLSSEECKSSPPGARGSDHW